MFPVGSTVKVSPQCHQEANGSDNCTEAQGCAGQGLLPLQAHGTCGSHSFWFVSCPALSVSKGQVWGNWEMLLPPQLSLHWKVRHRSSAEYISTWPFLLLPAKTKEYWEKGGAVLSVIQPTGFPQGVRVEFGFILQGLRYLMSITSCSAAGLTSIDVNTFGCVSPLKGLWLPKGENCQLWASPGWAVMPGSPGELRRGFHLLSECTTSCSLCRAQGQLQVSSGHLHLQQSDCTAHLQALLGLGSEV